MKNNNVQIVKVAPDLLWGSARKCLLAFSLCCHAAFISASTPGPAHKPCAPRGRLERVANSAAVEIMTSAMSLTMSLMQVGGRSLSGMSLNRER